MSVLLYLALVLLMLNAIGSMSNAITRNQRPVERAVDIMIAILAAWAGYGVWFVCRGGAL